MKRYVVFYNRNDGEPNSWGDASHEADSVAVTEIGALLFFVGGECVAGYAPGRWDSFEPEIDDEEEE